MFAPSISTLLANESCGTPSRSASIAPITPIRASVDSEPRMTTSNPIRPSTAASAAEVDSASDPASASSIRCTALSAPIDRALRMDSLAFSGPMVRMVTSPPCASARRRPSSTAYSSSSFMTPSAASRSRVESAARSLRSEYVSGTCFKQTTIFITGGQPPSCNCGPAGVARRRHQASAQVKPAKPPGLPELRVPGKACATGYLLVAEPPKERCGANGAGRAGAPVGRSGLLLGERDDLGQQHGPRHRAHAAGHRGQPAGYLGDRGVNVTD